MLSALQACHLIAADYAGRTAPERLDIDGVQASILADGVLLIRGSDERTDWIRNFRFFPITDKGDTTRWHRGFLAHARIAYAFAKGKNISCVIGHSLGAACAQIVASSLGVPGIAIASPRPLWGAAPAGANQIRNWCRTDDLVCSLPPSCFGFRHVGSVRWLRPTESHDGEDHRISHYIRALEEHKR